MMRFFHTISVLILALTILMASDSAMSATELYDIRTGVHPGKVRVVMDISQQTPYRVFTLSGPDRVVIDLPRMVWRDTSPGPGNQDIIRDIRHQNRVDGFTRIVLDLVQPAEVINVLELPPRSGKSPRLVLDLKPVSAARFAAIQTNIFGDPSFGPAAEATETSSSGMSFASLTLDSHMIVPKPKPGVAPVGLMIPPPKPFSKKRTIVIDPGHGGNDPGAIGASGTYEKHITLQVSRQLKSELEATGRYRVVLTRNRDKYLKLYERVDIARAAGADLFVSVHADTIHKKNVRGTSVYTLSEDSSDDMAALLAEQENKVDLIGGPDLSREEHDVANILLDLAMRETLNESKRFAGVLVGQMKSDQLRLLPNPHRYAGFAVLKAPDIPSVLIELGFLSSRREEDLLKTPWHQKKLAMTIANGIDAYFTRLAAMQQY